MIGKRILGAVASVALVAALTPAAAYASQVGAAQTHVQQAAPDVQVQAASAKVAMYVLTGVEATGQMSAAQTETCNYNGKGLVRRIKVSGGPSASTTKFTYDAKGGMTSYKSAGVEGSTSVSVTSSAKGLIKSARWHTEPTMYSTIATDHDVAFGYRGGKAVSRWSRMTSPDTNWDVTESGRLSYKKGRLKSVENTIADTSPKAASAGMSTSWGSERYSYDKRGNAVSKREDMSNGYSNATKYKNKYDKAGRLVKRVAKNGYGSKRTYTFTYKQVKVPKSAVAQVKRQQWALLNGNLNFALGAQALESHSMSAN